MQRTEPRLSVIIPTLNEESRIGPLLAALRAQTKNAHEVIVVDGESEDETASAVRSFIGQVEGLCLIEVERGTARQRNRGGQAATGDLLVFMDADTLPAPWFLERVSRSYSNWPFAVACPWFVAQETNIIVRLIYCTFNILFWLGQGWLRTGSGVCIVTPKNIFSETGGFEEGMHLGEDVRYIRRAARHGWHRHLLIPLTTSGRRFEEKGIWRLILFYLRISPLILLGRWKALEQIDYEAAPYKKGRSN